MKIPVEPRIIQYSHMKYNTYESKQNRSYLIITINIVKAFPIILCYILSKVDEKSSCNN